MHSRDITKRSNSRAFTCLRVRPPQAGFTRVTVIRSLALVSRSDGGITTAAIDRASKQANGQTSKRVQHLDCTLEDRLADRESKGQHPGFVLGGLLHGITVCLRWCLLSCVGRRCHVRRECRLGHVTAQRFGPDKYRSRYWMCSPIQDPPPFRLAVVRPPARKKRARAQAWEIDFPSPHDMRRSRSDGHLASESRAELPVLQQAESNNMDSHKPFHGDPASSHVDMYLIIAVCTSSTPNNICSPVPISIPYHAHVSVDLNARLALTVQLQGVEPIRPARGPRELRRARATRALM
jgi:hypothetical protein